MTQTSAAAGGGMRNPKSILVIMLRRIGDVILTLPAIRALKRLFPEAGIDLLTEPPCDQLLEGAADLRKVLRYSRPAGYRAAASAYLAWIGRVRRERYDWVIDYMGNPRSAMITSLSGAAVRAGPAHVSHHWAYSHRLLQSGSPCYAALEKIRVLRSLGLHPDETQYRPAISVPGDSRRRALAAVEERGWGAEKLVGLVPASRKATRRWPARSFARLGRLLRDRCGARLWVFWGPGEEALAHEVAGGIGAGAAAAPAAESLMDLAALLERCRLVVTNCSGPKHLAAACRVPTLTIHGSSDPACWNPPDDPRHETVRLDDLFCIGCRLNECPYNLECMTGLAPEAVALRAADMLERVSRLAPPAAGEAGGPAETNAVDAPGGRP